MSKLDRTLEKAARAYYEVRPLHYVWHNGTSVPVSWAEMLDSEDPVRVQSLAQHRKAIRAAFDAQAKDQQP